MNKIVILTMFLVLLSCNSSSNNTPKTTEEEPVVTDLTYLNGSTVLGEGVGASLSADTYLYCHSPIVSFLPKIFNKVLVAFGSTSGATCGQCTISYNCVPGETVTLDYVVSDDSTSPSDFEVDIAANEPFVYSETSEDVVCPESGISTLGEYAPNTRTLKVTVTGQLGSDTEYLDCYDI